MKTKLLHLSFILLLLGSLVYLSGCTPSKPPYVKPKPHKKFRSLCDTIKSNVIVNLNAVVFLDPVKGLAAGDDGTIIRTSNAGYNWTTVGGIPMVDLYGLAAADNANVIAVGNNGTILRSTNGGFNWSPILSDNVSFLKPLRTVGFYTNTNGYAAGDDGVVFFTSNAGVDWKKVHEDAKQTHYGISYNSKNTLFIVGKGGMILKDSIFANISTMAMDLNGIHFALDTTYFTHTDTGFIVGDKGAILKTTNGGDNWVVETPLTTENLRGVFLSNSHWGYAVGEKGAVLRYDGVKWVLLPSSTLKNLQAVDPLAPTPVCVGELGETLLYYPPAVTNGTSVSPDEVNCEDWTFNLNNLSTSDTDPSSGGIITYISFQVCASVVVDWGRTTTTGWAVHDNFYGRSFSFGTAPLPVGWSLQSSGNCIVTFYLMDGNGNPHTLSSYECTP